jgi:SAM-dependent methyltransferase
MRRGEPFLNKDQLKKKAEHWKAAAQGQERSDWNEDDAGLEYRYKVNRVERVTAPEVQWWTIDELHGQKFIEVVIPAILERKRSQGDHTPVTILDVGAGNTSYTQSLRTAFGDQVKVYSTGLRKATAEFSSALSGQGRLHQDDLKWRSTLQLSDYPEFDLIIDTVGEFTYGTPTEADRRKYIEAVMAKLKPGGQASITDGTGMHDGNGGVKEIVEDLSHNPNYAFKLAKALEIRRLK